MSLKDKVFIITGASSGIGAATAKLLAEKDAKVVIGARRQEPLEKIAAGAKAGNVLYKKTDVTDFQQVKDLADLAIEKFGKVDAIFNNAGIMPQSNLANGDRDVWKQTFDINVFGVLNGISAVLPIFHKQGHGHILVTDSMAGHQVYPGLSVYSGTKYALQAIVQGLRIEEARNNIRTSIISPGAVRTELFRSVGDEDSAEKLKKSWEGENSALRSEDVAEAVVYALDNPQRVNVSEIIVQPLYGDLRPDAF